MAADFKADLIQRGAIFFCALSDAPLQKIAQGGEIGGVGGRDGVDLLQPREAGGLALAQFGDFAREIAVDAVEGGLIVARGAGKFSRERSARLAECFGRFLERRLRGVFHVGHLPAQMVDAALGKPLRFIDAVRQRVHPLSRVSKRSLHFGAGFDHAFGDAVLQRNADAAEFDDEMGDGGVGLFAGQSGGGADLVEADMEAIGGFTREGAEILGDGVFERLMRDGDLRRGGVSRAHGVFDAIDPVVDALKPFLRLDAPMLVGFVQCAVLLLGVGNALAQGGKIAADIDHGLFKRVRRFGRHHLDVVDPGGEAEH